MSILSKRIRALAGDFLDRWLQIQATQWPAPRRTPASHGGMVLICGPCAEKKRALQEAVHHGS